MRLNSDGQFCNFYGWMENYKTDSETYMKLREWKGLVLSGPPRTVDFVAANLSSKEPSLFTKIKTLFKN